ncbi:hypothetical protein NC651_003838 [Populus alba x Populus x berolinensis]|nr:hypothetical protein NC651_003838 [Populus alba x Populus x berolinensis]
MKDVITAFKDHMGNNMLHLVAKLPDQNRMNMVSAFWCCSANATRVTMVQVSRTRFESKHQEKKAFYSCSKKTFLCCSP